MTWTWRLRAHTLVFDRPLLMGIVNVTPDSFSDGGLFFDRDRAIEHGIRLLEEGADVLDVGGESTRPGAGPVPVDEELARVIGVIEGLVARGALVSVDTTKPVVARSALDAGAEIVNDVGGLGTEEMRHVVASSGAGAVIMHMQGTPATMQLDPHYDDVVDDIVEVLAARIEAAVEAGCDRQALVVDPGIGFGKTLEQNLTLCNRIGSFEVLGRPVMIGTSRKRFLGTISGVEEAAERDVSTAVSLALAVERGAAVVRTHNVSRTREALAVALAIVNERVIDFDRSPTVEPRQHTT